MNKNKFVLSVIGFVGVAVVVMAMFTVFPIRATDYTLTDLDNQISNALDWLDRFIYYQYNDTNAVSSCAPFIAFRIRHSNGVNWTVSDKVTLSGNAQNAGGMLKGGCYQVSTADRGKTTSSYPKICQLWRFDIDEDKDYEDDIELYTEYSDVNATYVQLYINCTKQNCGNNFALFFADECSPMCGSWTSMQFNDTALLCTQWGWRSPFYFMRPTLKGLADLYYNLNRTAYPSGGTYASHRGINYTDRAYKLMRTFYNTGYLLDRFDGMYNVTLLERPFSTLHGCIMANPDLIAEQEWDFSPSDNSAGYHAYVYGHDYSDLWKSYAQVDTDLDHDFDRYNNSFIWRSASCCRTIMPDENWFYAPMQCGNTTVPCWCYRSRTGAPVARNAYIAGGFYDELLAQNLPTTPFAQVLMGTGSDAQMLRVCSDLYKYGAGVPYGLSWEAEMIQHVSWDGYGVPADYCKGAAWQWGGWDYPCYANHVNAPYLNALVQYGRLTNDDWFLQRADQVAQIILSTQVKQGVSFWNKEESGSYYMPDAVGSFLAGYCVAYSYGFGNIMWEPWTESIFSAMKWWYDLTGGASGFRFDEFPHCTFGSAESTLPCVWGLIEYRKLARLPAIMGLPDLALPLTNCVAYTDHGGSWGSDGEIEVANGDATKTYIGGDSGNVYRYDGHVDRLRMNTQALTGTSAWCSIQYEWNFTVVSALTNARFKWQFSIPCGVASHGIWDENDLEVYVNLYYANGTTVGSSYESILHDYDEVSDFYGMYAGNNSAPVSSLPAGNYHVHFKIKVSCCDGGQLRCGYRWVGASNAKDMPMGVESFGLDYERTEGEEYYGWNLAKSGSGHWHVAVNGGTENTTSSLNVTLGDIVGARGDADTGNYTWFWIARNGNNSATPPAGVGSGLKPRNDIFYGCSTNGTLFMNVTHGYNITVYFSNYNYTFKRDNYAFTVYMDLNFDGLVNMRDYSGVINPVMYKKQGDADWESSGAMAVDQLINADGVVNMRDVSAFTTYCYYDLADLVW